MNFDFTNDQKLNTLNVTSILAVNDEKVSERRLSKYVNSLKDKIFHDYIDVQFNNLNLTNFAEFICAFLQVHMKYFFFSEDCSEEAEETLKSLFFVPHFYYETAVGMLSEETKERIFDVLSTPVNSYFLPGSNCGSFSDIVDFELRGVALDFMRYRRAKNSLLNEQNMFFEVPNTPEDYIMIIKEVCSRVYTELILFTGIPEVSDARGEAEYVKSIYREYEDELTSLRNQNAKMSEDISSLKSKFNSLIAPEEAEKRVQNAYKDCSEMITLTNRKYSKLLDKYNALAEKYNALSKNIADGNNEELVEAIDSVEVDLTKRYVFIVEEDVGFTEQIKDEFPNAVFSNSENIKEMNCDLVVFLTAFVSHSKYLNIKNQCKSNNIPFVHCAFTNVEMIKSAIRSIS